jgi:hypothetical protein
METWSVEWMGPRGGKWTTGPITEEKAREKFTSLGNTTWALLLKCRGNLLGMPMNEVIERNTVAKIAATESALKDHLKREKAIQKSITYCRDEIKKLKKELKP